MQRFARVSPLFALSLVLMLSGCSRGSDANTDVSFSLDDESSYATGDTSSGAFLAGQMNMSVLEEADPRQKSLEEYALSLNDVKNQIGVLGQKDMLTEKQDVEQGVAALEAKMPALEKKVEELELDPSDINGLRAQVLGLKKKLNSFVEVPAPRSLISFADKKRSIIDMIQTKKGIWVCLDKGMYGPITGESLGDAHLYETKSFLRSCAYDAKAGDLLVLTQDYALARLKDGVYTRLTGTPVAAKQIATYGSSIYMYDANAGALLKRGRDDLNLKDSQVSLGADKLGGTVLSSFAIDGAVYAISVSGDLLKYHQGRKVEMNINTALGMLDNESDIFTTQEDSNLYVLNHALGRVYVFKKAFSALDYSRAIQFTGKLLNKLAVDPSGKVLYTADSKEIFSFGL